MLDPHWTTGPFLKGLSAGEELDYKKDDKRASVRTQRWILPVESSPRNRDFASLRKMQPFMCCGVDFLLVDLRELLELEHIFVAPPNDGRPSAMISTSAHLVQ